MKHLTISAAAFLALCGATAATAATPAGPTAPDKVRLFYDGDDDPIGIAFTTSKPIETQRTNPGLRGGAGVLNTTGSLSHLVKSKSCYTTRVANQVVRRLKVGNKYVVTIKIGTATAQKTYHRTVTLKKVSGIKTIAKQLNCI